MRPSAVCKIWEFNPQELVDTVWAFATLAVVDSVPLQAVRPAAVLHIWEFNPQDLANTARAMATLVVEDSALLEAMRPAAVLQSGSSSLRSWRTPRVPWRRRRWRSLCC